MKLGVAKKVDTTNNQEAKMETMINKPSNNIIWLCFDIVSHSPLIKMHILDMFHAIALEFLNLSVSGIRCLLPRKLDCFT